ncbi:MFS transporter [Tistrella mobilis]|uniref:MFS transporter n=1 Tax=Tistrella mobilis TaxID=171437 RepID=UPI0035579968
MSLATRARGPIFRLTLALALLLPVCMGIAGFLNLTALKRVDAEATVSEVTAIGGKWADRLQVAVRYGKPIEKFSGLDDLLDDVRQDIPLAGQAAVVDRRGQVLGSRGEEAAVPVVGADQGGQVVERVTAGRRWVLFPIRDAGGAVVAHLGVALPEEAHTAEIGRTVQAMVAAAAAATILGVLVTLGLGFVSARGRAADDVRLKRMRVAGIAVVVLAQAGFAAYAIGEFRSAVENAAARQGERLAASVANDLDQLINKGIALRFMGRIEDNFARLIDQVPLIGGAALVGPDGTRIAVAGVTGPDAGPVVTRDLTTVAGSGGRPAGRIEMTLSGTAIADSVQSRVLDAVTLALVSAMIVGEGLIFVFAAVRGRTGAGGIADSRFARPMAFLFLLAWSLPLSFVPLAMRLLAAGNGGETSDIMMAAPVSAEMMCALVTALIAGPMADRRGWQVPVLTGFGLCVLANLVSLVVMATQTHPAAFIAARALGGLGYGFAWMGIQSHLYATTLPERRASATAGLIAGIFVGQMCGTAIGAMLAEQLGYANVFLVAALFMVMPLIVALVAVSVGREPATVAESKPAAAAPVPAEAGGGWRGLFTDRTFMLVLICSVIPFSIAQVGLLNFAVPVYLAEQGINQSDIGRVLMVNGLAVILLGPLFGRLTDRVTDKRPFIVAGALAAAAALVVASIGGNLMALVAAVFLIGVSGSIAGGAQSAHGLQGEGVARAGIGRAVSMKRSADKFGQMLGPLIVGGLFAVVGTTAGLAATAGLMLAAGLLFLLLDRRPAPPRVGEAEASS